MNTNEAKGNSPRLTRRGLLATAATAMAAGAASTAVAAQRRGRGARRASPGEVPRAVTKGRINQSVCEWCFTSDASVKPMSLEELARISAAMGIKSIELVDPKNWPILKKHGLVCALANSHWFDKGWAHKDEHAECKAKIIEAVDACADAGFPNVITFSGYRKGMPDDVGLKNCVQGLKTVVGYAEKKKVNLVLEMLNTRVSEDMKGHPPYMGDSVEWCIEICKQVGSDRMKLLFDVYHVQIMEGDIITRIRQFKDYIGHYHVAGVPGRNEPDNTQELNFPPIMRAIVDTGYTGYVAQEFIPTRDPVRVLGQAVKLCDV